MVVAQWIIAKTTATEPNVLLYQISVKVYVHSLATLCTYEKKAQASGRSKVVNHKNGGMLRWRGVGFATGGSATQWWIAAGECQDSPRRNTRRCRRMSMRLRRALWWMVVVTVTGIFLALGHDIYAKAIDAMPMP